MALLKAFISPAASPITPVTPSATVGDHDSDGTDITITAVAHGLQVGELVTLDGWTWATGGGVVNGTYYVKTVASADTFVVTPTTAPTNLSNPTVVGTYALASHDFGGMRIGVVASSGYLVVLPSGTWMVTHTGFDVAGAASTAALAYRYADSVADTTLPTATHVVNTRAAQRSLLIEAGKDAFVEIRGKPGALLLESATGSICVTITPIVRGISG